MPDDLAERLSFVVGAMNRRLRPGGDTLTHVALSALASIERAGTIRPGDLARVEGIAAPAMTRVVTDLADRGLVSRSDDPDDGRAHLVALSREGATALARARRQRAAALEAMLGDVSPDERGALERAVAVLERSLLARSDVTPVGSATAAR